MNKTEINAKLQYVFEGLALSPVQKKLIGDVITDLVNVVGTPGQDGVTPTITCEATVDANTGTPSVEVTKSGTNETPTFTFAFKNLKGATGAAGADATITPAAAVDDLDSGANTTTIVASFNALLANLRAAGLLAQ